LSLNLVIGVLGLGMMHLLADTTDEQSPRPAALFGTEQGHEMLPELATALDSLHARVTQLVELHSPLVAFLAGVKVGGENTRSVRLHVVSFFCLLMIAPHSPEVLGERKRKDSKKWGGCPPHDYQPLELSG